MLRAAVPKPTITRAPPEHGRRARRNPTVRRCIGFARRPTDPECLRSNQDPGELQRFQRKLDAA
jgi:hypothetical protein